MNSNFRNFAIWVIIILLLVALFNLFKNPTADGRRANEMPYSEFLNNVDGLFEFPEDELDSQAPAGGQTARADLSAQKDRRTPACPAECRHARSRCARRSSRRRRLPGDRCRAGPGDPA